jgi:hypothetical protein
MKHRTPPLGIEWLKTSGSNQTMEPDSIFAVDQHYVSEPEMHKLKDVAKQLDTFESYAREQYEMPIYKKLGAVVLAHPLVDEYVRVLVPTRSRLQLHRKLFSDYTLEQNQEPVQILEAVRRLSQDAIFDLQPPMVYRRVIEFASDHPITPTSHDHELADQLHGYFQAIQRHSTH